MYVESIDVLVILACSKWDERKSGRGKEKTMANARAQLVLSSSRLH